MTVINLKKYARSLQPRLYNRYEKITAEELAAELRTAAHENGGHLSSTEQALILLYMKHLGYNETFHKETFIQPSDSEVIRIADEAAGLLGVEILQPNTLLHIEENCLRQEADQRNIRHCVHFTQAGNLSSIIQHGLLTRTVLDEKHIDYKYNDGQRFDAVQGSISISLTFPNYKMFYKCRRHMDVDWAVLLLDPFYVLSLDCAYCYTNAASNAVSKTSLEERSSLASFLGLFYEPEEISRQQLGLADNETTDPQAELLVREMIPLEAMQCVIFQNEETALKYRDELAGHGLEVIVDGAYFKPRHDHSSAWG
ncbi:DarT ssDNA thymidine ADP-ribosyltransferase family protein [Selenomonas ruminantium]|uniref:DarT domain-containing protein n=1 Tax=Selenomonas ruminantium TaxID=971 RepID=A0A1K1NLG2_SELRU|nr:DarT ssDNA thymidine ADP-ribosyltransferase family protein [Selenomonas ruminantium]SFW36113.1 protein of unknown function [Selenomonas ruminantium]